MAAQPPSFQGQDGFRSIKVDVLADTSTDYVKTDAHEASEGYAIDGLPARGFDRILVCGVA
jgi:hypothetical protein